LKPFAELPGVVDSLGDAGLRRNAIGGEAALMTRYTTPRGPEGEYEPGSRGRVLKNLLGIKSVAAMDMIEAEALDAVQKRYYTEGNITDKTSITAATIRQMHADWLGGIYEWAGHYRTVDMSKGGFAFPPAYLIEQNMARLESELLAKLTPCRAGPIGMVCLAVAKIHADFLLIHPFREGNGRLARWLADTMFAQAGLNVPDYDFGSHESDKRRDDYLRAVLKGYGGEYSDLAAFFECALERDLEAARNLDRARGDAPSNTDES
jgi:cell filamentation protein